MLGAVAEKEARVRGQVQDQARGDGALVRDSERHGDVGTQGHRPKLEVRHVQLDVRHDALAGEGDAGVPPAADVEEDRDALGLGR